jgi:hypothetical protein
MMAVLVIAIGVLIIGLVIGFFFGVYTTMKALSKM